MATRPIDDRLAEALWRPRQVATRPLWQDLPDEIRDGWIDRAKTMLWDLNALGLEVKDKNDD